MHATIFGCLPLAAPNADAWVHGPRCACPGPRPKVTGPSSNQYLRHRPPDIPLKAPMERRWWLEPPRRAIVTFSRGQRRQGAPFPAFPASKLWRPAIYAITIRAAGYVLRKVPEGGGVTIARRQQPMQIDWKLRHRRTISRRRS